ncbi:DUF4625 domain-containing protein [Ancylomarina sp. YFZ004]
MAYFTSPKSRINKIRFNSKLFICLLTFLPLVGFSYISQEQTDKVSPKINLLSPNTHFEVRRGDKIHINAQLQDDQELASYRIVISKGGITADKYSDAFSTHQQLDAEGKAFPTILGAKSYELNLDVKVGENAIVGDYNFKFHLKDKAGNEHIVERFFNVSRD